MKALVSILVLAFLLGSCVKDENTASDNFASIYGGKPFEGSAEAVLEREGFENLNWNGDGTITLIESSTDSVSVVFLADFGNQSEINFKMRGKVDGVNLRFEGNESLGFFRIVDEKITGRIDNEVQEMRFEGMMKKEQAKMTAQIYFKEASDPFPKGSTLSLSFDTNREVSDDDDDGSGCQMRLVPIWGPNGMTMGMVPDC